MSGGSCLFGTLYLLHVRWLLAAAVVAFVCRSLNASKQVLGVNTKNKLRLFYVHSLRLSLHARLLPPPPPIPLHP